MSTLQWDIATRFLDGSPPDGTVVLCAITGSHIYGFSSPDSDIDIKGIHLAPTEVVLGLRPPPLAHDRLTIFEGVECDLTTHEAGAALALMLKGNGNMLERIFSPIQLVRSPAADELRELARGALSRRCIGHYLGFFKGMQRESLRQEAPRAKTLLYSYRVALTGIHLLLTGTVVSDLPTLAREHGYPEVDELVSVKREGTEKGVLPSGDAERFRAAWPRLEAGLEEAHSRSPLPSEAPNVEAVNDWLVAQRRAVLT
jgi:predicted nucleotidyltransferase